MRTKIALGLAIMVASAQAPAVTYPFPMVTDVALASEPNEYGEKVTHVTSTRIMVTDPRISEEATLREALEILTGEVVTNRVITGRTMQRGWYGPNSMATWNAVSTQGNPKFTEFMEEWTAAAVANNSIPGWVEKQVTHYCATNRVAYRSGTGTSWAQHYDTTWGLDDINTCVHPHPIDEHCTLNTPMIDFDYGVISASAADGTWLETLVHVQCSNNMKYKLNVVGGPEISIDNGMAAAIMTDGELAGATLEGQTGDNTVTLRSTLRGKPARTGAFAGSGIMVVSYP
ncbi:hypothetical protein [Pantoea ananatis]|uniref:hypothetical protein n=1 Tax=Pantoea ananas TaxID=553 RepID=UPI001C8A4317|nr:hypothetical protein [Pantoea ananatis]QZE28253.1 hypothetical protein K4732_15175 [Pantoea ananatis]